MDAVVEAVVDVVMEAVDAVEASVELVAAVVVSPEAIPASEEHATSASRESLWLFGGSEEERVEVGEGPVENVKASSESRLDTEKVDEQVEWSDIFVFVKF